MTTTSPILNENPKRTFLEILQVHNKELPMAQLLGYFFKPHETHGLGDLFIKALLQTKCYNIIDNDQSIGSLQEHGYTSNKHTDTRHDPGKNKKVSVAIEKPIEQLTNCATDKKNQKRIDILIETDDIVLCIEFKIEHVLDNPLADYKAFVAKTYPSKKSYFVVLTPYKKTPEGSAKKHLQRDNSFKQVILSHFVETIAKEVPEDYYSNPTVDSSFLKIFLQTITNRKIKTERKDKLKALGNYLEKKQLSNTYRPNAQGGFLEFKTDPYHLKIRIRNGAVDIEQWKSPKPKNKVLSSVACTANSKEIYKALCKEMEGVAHV